MEFNRNQFMMTGVLVMLFGIQFRTFESFTLNEKTTHFVVSRLQDTGQAPAGPLALASTNSISRKVVRPPQWLGWSLMSIGSVLILHSFAMKKPGG